MARLYEKFRIHLIEHFLLLGWNLAFWATVARKVAGWVVDQPVKRSSLHLVVCFV